MFIHVPPKPGGKLGLLDAASSIALFMAAGHLFFTSGSRGRWWWAVGRLHRCWARCCSRGGSRSRATTASWRSLLTALAAWLRRPGGGFWAAARARFGADAAEGPIAVLRIASVFLLVSVFWALFDQQASSWVLQAESMNLTLWGIRLLPSQIPSANPVLVMILIPYTQQAAVPDRRARSASR